MNDSPFAHRIARTPKKITPANDERRTTPVLIEPMPLSDDDLGCEEEIIPVAKATPALIAAPVATPVAPVARAESSGMRQTIVAVAAFIVTTLALLLAVVVWKSVFAG